MFVRVTDTTDSETKTIFHNDETIMKKSLIILGFIFFIVSCNKENATNSNLTEGRPEDNQSPKEIIFDLNANHPDGNPTKAVKTGWEKNDVIYVFFSGQRAPRYLEMKWNGSEWI